MNKIFTILLIIITFSSCAQDFKDDFPTEIKTNKTEDHKRVEGTKIFAIIPTEYKFIDNLSRYQKEDNLYVQFIELNASNFHQAKPNFSREAIESKGAEVDILKDSKLNELNAVFGDGPSNIPNERKTLFVFGDSEFVIIVVGVYPKNDIKGRREILEIFKNLVYLKNFELDPFELVNFEFDQSITGFKYSSSMSFLTIFNKEGNPESEGIHSNSIDVGNLPKMSLNKGIEFIKSIIQNGKNSGTEYKSSDILNVKIGKYEASILETEMIIENKKAMLYIAMLYGKDSNVLFMGTSFDKDNKLFEKFKETVETINIK